MNEPSSPDPVCLRPTSIGQVSPGQFQKAPGQCSGALAGTGDGRAGDHPREGMLEAMGFQGWAPKEAIGRRDP